MGNPFKYHVPGSGFVFTTFVMYITTTMCDGVLHCLLFLMFFWCPNRSTPVAQLAPRNLLTRWDVSSIPANGIFLTKNKKNKIKMPNGWRTINSLVHKIRLHGRRGKGMAESFSRQKSRHAPQKEGGLKILCDLPPV